MSIPTGPPTGDGGYVMTKRCIVSPDEFKDYLSGVNMTDIEKTVAEDILAGTQQELETYLNRPIQPIRVRQVVSVDLAGYANLYVSPVWEILNTSVVGGGSPLAGQITTLPGVPEGVEFVDYINANYASAAPTIVPGGFYFGGYEGAQLLVDYIGGWNGYQEGGLKTAIMRVAAREYAGQMDDFLSLQRSSAQEGAKPDNRDIGWTEEELRKWDRLRRRVIA